MSRNNSDAAPPQAEEEEPIPFTPVPVRARADGWTEARQRAFVAALKRIGSVSTAARAVGKTRASAYRLRTRPGAESFAAAWDEAAERGLGNVHDTVIDRALHGAVVPRFYKGRQTGLVHRYYDSIAIAVLSGRGATLKQRLEEAEERGARKAFFEIERAWQRDRQEWARDQQRLAAAEEKLARLVRAGIVGPDWLGGAAPPPDLPPRTAPKPAPPEPRPAGRIRFL